jgi:DNA-binding response OmpR family regulator
MERERKRQYDSDECRILIADDNEDAAESLCILLQMSGAEVRTVNGGAQAVEVASTFRPNIVFLDIGMPRLNGLDTARQIRKQSWGSDMFLVALSGWGTEEDKRHAAKAGFDEHLTKPANPLEIENLVSDLCSRRCFT